MITDPRARGLAGGRRVCQMQLLMFFQAVVPAGEGEDQGILTLAVRSVCAGARLGREVHSQGKWLQARCHYALAWLRSVTHRDLTQQARLHVEDETPNRNLFCDPGMGSNLGDLQTSMLLRLFVREEAHGSWRRIAGRGG